MAENSETQLRITPERLYLPTLIQESLLPLRTGPTKLTRKYRDVDITVRAGAFGGKDLVLPAGAIARKLFHYIITTANHHSSPIVDLVSMKHLIRTIGVSYNAKNVKRIKEELLCLSRMSIDIDLYKEVDGVASAFGGTERLVSKFSLNGVNEEGQMSLFGSWLELSPEFWERLQQHKHQPIARDAVWSLSKPLAIDVYLWLQRRCQARDIKEKGTLIRWEWLEEQFGRAGRLNKLKRDLIAAIEAAAPKLVRHEWDEVNNKPVVKITDDGVILRPIPRQVLSKESEDNTQQGFDFSVEDYWRHPEPKRVVAARRKRRKNKTL